MSSLKINSKWVEVRLTGSIIGRTERQRATVRGLGLHRIGSRSRLQLTPEVRGMINKVIFLVDVKDAEPKPKAKATDTKS